MKKKQKIISTDKGKFFGLLKRAALPHDQTGQQKSDAQTVADYGGNQTHSHSSGDADGKHGGKSRQRSV